MKKNTAQEEKSNGGPPRRARILLAVPPYHTPGGTVHITMKSICWLGCSVDIAHGAGGLSNVCSIVWLANHWTVPAFTLQDMASWTSTPHVFDMEPCTETTERGLMDKNPPRPVQHTVPNPLAATIQFIWFVVTTLVDNMCRAAANIGQRKRKPHYLHHPRDFFHRPQYSCIYKCQMPVPEVPITRSWHPKCSSLVSGEM